MLCCVYVVDCFVVMASSMKLEYPLNDVLPNIDHARDRLDRKSVV